MILHILVPFGRNMKTDLSLRYILVDTIENRNVGRVIEEGVGEDGLHVTVQTEGNLQVRKSELFSLLKSLGHANVLIKEIVD